MTFVITLTVIIVALAKNCLGGSVLFLPPMTSASHKLAMVVWADALAERGHDVYWWAPASKLDHYQPKKTKHVDHYAIDVDNIRSMSLFRYENNSLLTHAWWYSDQVLPGIETYMTYLLTQFCEKIITEHAASTDSVLSRKYDLIIIDEYFNPCGLLVAQLLKAPVATYVSTCRTTRTSNWHNGVPVPYSIAPYFGYSRFSDKMSFTERVSSSVYWFVAYWADWVMLRSVTKDLAKYYPGINGIESSLIQPEFQFLCVPKQLDQTLPMAHNLIHIGGLQIKDNVPPLNNEFQSMVDSAKKGFIIATFGHWANWVEAPERLRRALIEAFSKVSSDYIVFWQYNGPVIPNLPKHIKTVKWIPQQSLLANPKCVLFITHAGCNGLIEGVQNAVPMIAIPLQADQPDGAVKVSKMGFGFHLHKLYVTGETLYDAIFKILSDNKYKQNVKRMSDILKKDSMTSLERAIFWTEFAMKHGGKHHYKSSLNAINMSFIKYYAFDIIIPFILIFYISCRLIISISKFILRKLM